MRKTRTIFYTFFIAVALLFAACNKKEDVIPPSGTCDTLNVSYATVVKPIIESQCLSCHSQASATGGVILEQYSNFAPYTTSGKLVNAIQYNGTIVMPPAGKLPDCSISQVRSWVSAGAPNN